MIIAHNFAAMNATRQFKLNKKTQQTATERLSSGFRINRAADDAAGLAISEKMRAQIRGLDQGTRNVQDGISFCNVADGALNEVHAVLGRIRELAVKAASDTYVEEDRRAIEDEFSQLKQEIDRISRTTEFNTKRIFDDGVFKVEFSDDICLCILQPVYLQFIPNMIQPHFWIRHTLRHLIQTQNLQCYKAPASSLIK